MKKHILIIISGLALPYLIAGVYFLPKYVPERLEHIKLLKNEIIGKSRPMSCFTRNYCGQNFVWNFLEKPEYRSRYEIEDNFDNHHYSYLVGQNYCSDKYPRQLSLAGGGKYVSNYVIEDRKIYVQMEKKVLTIEEACELADNKENCLSCTNIFNTFENKDDKIRALWLNFRLTLGLIAPTLNVLFLLLFLIILTIKKRYFLFSAGIVSIALLLFMWFSEPVVRSMERSTFSLYKYLSEVFTRMSPSEFNGRYDVNVSPVLFFLIYFSWPILLGSGLLKYVKPIKNNSTYRNLVIFLIIATVLALLGYLLYGMAKAVSG